MFKKQPLVSILIPVYNRGNLIRETLMSALAQSYQNIEVIVVDNCSTDNTWEVVKEISRIDDRVKCFQNDINLGPVKNWKACIDRASGEFGKILWSDDLIADSYIEKTLTYFETSDVGFVYTKTEIFFEDSDISEKHAVLPKTGVYSTEEFIIGSILGTHYPVSPGCAIFRLKDLKDNLLLNIPNRVNSDFSMHAIGNDLLIFLLTANRYSKFAYVDSVLSRFRAHKGSISVSSSDGKLPLHYALAKAFFIESNRPDLLKKYNVELMILLMRYKNSAKYGLNNVADFYLESNSPRYDVLYMVSRVFSKLAHLFRP
ncbi:glycosyltransferase family 2 protein [Vibrio vulnificus]|nr:glycosyltransferase family 2 protein [Vibrio vulnificus]